MSWKSFTLPCSVPAGWRGIVRALIATSPAEPSCTWCYSVLDFLRQWRYLMDRLNKKIALITSGGAGPGARIARHFHEEGATLIINGMRDDAA